MTIVRENYEFILADFGVNGCISDGGVLGRTEFYNMLPYLSTCGPGSSVGIATD